MTKSKAQKTMPKAKLPKSFYGYMNPSAHSEVVVRGCSSVFSQQHGAAPTARLPVLITFINPEDDAALRLARGGRNAQQKANAARKKSGTGFPLGKHNSAPSRARTPK